MRLPAAVIRYACAGALALGCVVAIMLAACSSVQSRVPPADASRPVTPTQPAHPEAPAPSADAAAQPSAAPPTLTAPAADRAAILRLVGAFDRSETMQPVGSRITNDPPVATRSTWVTLLVEDTGNRIVLQHFLLFGQAPLVIKSSREDWRYQPESVVAALLPGVVATVPLPPAERVGIWSRTLYGADDAPGYTGWGAWQHEASASVWEAAQPVHGTSPVGASGSSETLVTLPRVRDRLTVEHPDPSADAAFAWWQTTLPQELPAVGVAQPLSLKVTRYAPSSSVDPNVVAAEWEPQAPYWAAVRGQWSCELAAHPLLRVLDRDEREGERRLRWKAIMTAVQRAAADPAMDPQRFGETLPQLFEPFVHDAR